MSKRNVQRPRACEKWIQNRGSIKRVREVTCLYTSSTDNHTYVIYMMIVGGVVKGRVCKLSTWIQWAHDYDAHPLVRLEDHEAQNQTSGV